MANITYSVIERSCNKLLIGKTFWKTIVLPSILYGTNIINLTEDNINEITYRKLRTVSTGPFWEQHNTPQM